MGIVARGGAEAAALVLAGEHEVYGGISREGFRVAQEMQRDKAPVDAV